MPERAILLRQHRVRGVPEQAVPGVRTLRQPLGGQQRQQRILERRSMAQVARNLDADLAQLFQQDGRESHCRADAGSGFEMDRQIEALPQRPESVRREQRLTGQQIAPFRLVKAPAQSHSQSRIAIILHLAYRPPERRSTAREDSGPGSAPAV